MIRIDTRRPEVLNAFDGTDGKFRGSIRVEEYVPGFGWDGCWLLEGSCSVFLPFYVKVG